ncbi:MAG: hypothetical protein ACI8VC_000665 [Candidatus Endobugula sp.]|jgi:hypothetical protein
MSRCVRRSYLCGTDKLTGQCYEHRRQWIEDRIRLLSTVFAIEIDSYAVMSNHYHIVLRIELASTENWSFDEVIQRWLCLHKGPFLIQKYQKGDPIGVAEMNVLTRIVDDWRVRLTSVSEFMQQLNQVIARQANIEENCTGRFWGRDLRLQCRHFPHPCESGSIQVATVTDRRSPTHSDGLRRLKSYSCKDGGYPRAIETHQY